MLDRCLYAFEMAWHHSFSIASANCMLDPERSENKGFLEALFRQLQVLSHLLPSFGGSSVGGGCFQCRGMEHDAWVV